MTSLCSYKKLAGQSLETSPSAFLMAPSLLFPLAIKTIFLALKIVSTPIDIALFGWNSFSLKNLELSFKVCELNETSLVFENLELPGSLNAMWPLDPIPNN